MNGTKISATFFATAIVATSGAAFAAPDLTVRGHLDRKLPGLSILKYDTDRDGRVSRQEMRVAAAAEIDRRIDRVDANHDGILTPREQIQARGSSRIIHGLARTVAASPLRAELLQRAERRFTRHDHNQDGAVTIDEVRQGPHRATFAR